MTRDGQRRQEAGQTDGAESEGTAARRGATSDLLGRIAELERMVAERDGRIAALEATQDGGGVAGRPGLGALLPAVLDNAPFGAFVYELSPTGDLRFRGANRAADQILGADCSGFIGKTLEEAFPALAGTAIPAAYRAVAGGDTRLWNELVDYDEQGIRGTFDVHAVQLGPNRVAVFFRDISEQRRMIKELRESKLALRAVVDGAYDAIFIHAPDGKILDVNAKTLELYGVTREEIRNLSIADDLSCRAYPREHLDQIWQCVMAGEPQRFEWRARRPRDGTEFDVEVFLRKIHYRGVDAVLANVRDLTDRKSLEQQFAHAQKMEAIGRLASGAAHDFRNYLLMIASYTQVMLEELPQESMLRQDLEEILKATVRAEELTKQLLSFARSEPNVPRVLGVNDEMARMAQMLERLLGKKIELRLELAPDAGRARLDPSQLEQVMVNLAVNARDAMPSGGRLTIRTARSERTSVAPMQSWMPRTEQVIVEVVDTGAGIAAELLPRIFEPFFTTKPAGMGTGLGLSTVYAAVRQNGGEITVESERGVGTKFRLSFPRVAGETHTRGAPER